MPGKRGSRRSSLQIRFCRSSSFTVRCAAVRSPYFLWASRAPKVSGRLREGFIFRAGAPIGDCSSWPRQLVAAQPVPQKVFPCGVLLGQQSGIAGAFDVLGAIVEEKRFLGRYANASNGVMIDLGLRFDDPQLVRKRQMIERIEETGRDAQCFAYGARQVGEDRRAHALRLQMRGPAEDA